MNVEDLREQLEQLAGSPSRPTADARDGVRRRVARHHRRMSATGVMAAALVVAIIGVGVWNAQDSPVKVRTVPSTTPPARDFECETGVEVVPKTGTPLEVFAWADGAPVVGHGELWTVRSLLSTAPTLQQGIWRTKIAWFTRPFGIPRFEGRRLDGAGTFHAEGNAATDQHGTWVASSLEFSQPGCWEVTTSFDNSKIVFRILVGDPPRPLAIGTIEGTLRLVGGPAPGLDRAIAGTISIDGAGASTAAMTTTGDFSVDVPVGTYTVSGTSPMYQSGDARCRAAGAVAVARSRTTKATVICVVR